MSTWNASRPTSLNWARSVATLTDRGIYRMAFTDADMEGKRWLTERIQNADLEAQDRRGTEHLGRACRHD